MEENVKIEEVEVVEKKKGISKKILIGAGIVLGLIVTGIVYASKSKDDEEDDNCSEDSETEEIEVCSDVEEL